MNDTVGRLIVGLVIVVVALLLGRWLQARRVTDAPTQRRAHLPEQIDRADFRRIEAAWLVAVFTSDSCRTCEDVVDKAQVVACDDVEVQVVSYQRHAELQRRYGIDSVPSLIVADHAGVVHASAVGPITATDLWALVADARFPGSIERGECGTHDHPDRRAHPAQGDRDDSVDDNSAHEQDRSREH